MKLEDYDIDSSASTLLANLTKSNYSNNDGYLPSEDFMALTPEAKKLWRSLSSDMRAIILKGRKKNSNK